MNIDLLPLAAFALESSPGEERLVAQAHTLTLRLMRPALLSSNESPMSGTVEIEAIRPVCENVPRAAIMPAEGLGLTITF
jgi:hypothetical protein